MSSSRPNIREYLDHIAPDASVHPADPWERAQVRYWTKAVDEDLHPACGALTFMGSHRHTVLRNLGPEGAKKFLASTPEFSVTADWNEKKQIFVRYGFDAPEGPQKVKLYDSYLRKMDKALEGRDWLVGDRFSVADISLTPYVNRLAMMSIRGMWENGRLPNVERWFAAIEAMPNFRSGLLDWAPDHLTNALRENGAKSWPEVARILEIEI